MTSLITNLGIANETSLLIVVLLPLTAGMLVSQTNPYHALVIRGIVGAIAALVYALFGAADVALTEAFVGTMLSIMLYVVAVRSSMTMRVGRLKGDVIPKDQVNELMSRFRAQLHPHHLRVEVTTYDTIQALDHAMESEEIHTIIKPAPADVLDQGCQVQTRLELLRSMMSHPSITAIAPVSLYSPPSIESEIQGAE